MSQTTVREALGKLENAGLVRRVPNQGTFVTQLSAKELQEHVALRILLESAIAREAASRMQSENYRELEARLGKLGDAIARNDYFGTSEADLEFHRYIWIQSANHTLRRVLEQVTAPMFAFAMLGRRRNHEELSNVVRSHEPIIAALRDGSPDRIHEAIRIHVEDSYSSVVPARYGQ